MYCIVEYNVLDDSSYDIGAHMCISMSGNKMKLRIKFISPLTKMKKIMTNY